MQLTDLIGEVGGGQAGGQQVVGPSLDDNLAQVAAGHVTVEDVRDVLNLRSKLIVGIVAQLRRAVAAGQDNGKDGKDRWRHLLDGEFDAGGELRAGGADAVPGELFGPFHVGAGAEVDGQVAAAA